jgi:predicted RNA binding protein YcfA (HicA-like mRNA interferase family)
MSGKEVCAILAHHGFSEVRRRGSHIVMQRVGKDGSTITIPVPDHKELRIGTLRSKSVNRV